MSTVELALLVSLISGPSAVECRAGPDTDVDGLSDSCEIELAERFAPIFAVSPRSCNWDPDSERLVGGYLFGAAPIEGGVRLVYLPAYVLDCGWSGPKCLLRWRGGCDPHAGDSEFVAVDLTGIGDDWRVTRVFLSAHCFGRSEDDCRWHDPVELEWLGGAPLIWVAEGKNANYVSRSACDAGHWRFDTCDRNSRAVRFPLSAGHNIGSAEAPFPEHVRDQGCVSSAELMTSSLGPGHECIWTDAEFRGWASSTTKGATGYSRYLTEIAELGPPSQGLDLTRR